MYTFVCMFSFTALQTTHSGTQTHGELRNTWHAPCLSCSGCSQRPDTRILAHPVVEWFSQIFVSNSIRIKGNEFVHLTVDGRYFASKYTNGGSCRLFILRPPFPKNSKLISFWWRPEGVATGINVASRQTRFYRNIELGGRGGCECNGVSCSVAGRCW